MPPDAIIEITKSQEMPPDAIIEITKSQEMHQVVMQSLRSQRDHKNPGKVVMQSMGS
jgi:hypothetical protein